MAAILLSLIFFDLKIIGTREGTIIAAVFTGLAVKFFDRCLRKPLTDFLTEKAFQ